jgi:hypothetical protein
VFRSRCCHQTGEARTRRAFAHAQADVREHETRLAVDRPQAFLVRSVWFWVLLDRLGEDGLPCGVCLSSSGSDLAYRAISTGRLNALLRLHLRPIDVVVFHGPQGRPGFEGGFPLRCLQRLSCPHIATLHCGWRHNSSTSGAFTPVLSY